MASPIGHALAGYLIGRVVPYSRRQPGWTLVAICSVLAVSPDLDFLPGLLQGQPALYHQGISHSLGCAIFVSVLAALLYGKGRAAASLGGLFFLAYGSHLVMDMLGPDSRPPYGIPLFWPVSDQYYIAPFQVFRGFRHVAATSDSTAEWVSNIVQPYNLGTFIIEAAIFLPLIFLVEYFGKDVRLRSRPDRNP